MVMTHVEFQKELTRIADRVADRFGGYEATAWPFSEKHEDLLGQACVEEVFKSSLPQDHEAVEAWSYFKRQYRLTNNARAIVLEVFCRVE